VPVETASWRDVFVYPFPQRAVVLLLLPFERFMEAKQRGGGIIRRANISGEMRVHELVPAPVPWGVCYVRVRVKYVGRRGNEIEEEMHVGPITDKTSFSRDLDVYTEFAGPGIQAIALEFEAGGIQRATIELSIDMWYSWT